MVKNWPRKFITMKIPKRKRELTNNIYQWEHSQRERDMCIDMKMIWNMLGYKTCDQLTCLGYDILWCDKLCLDCFVWPLR